MIVIIDVIGMVCMLVVSIQQSCVIVWDVMAPLVADPDGKCSFGYSVVFQTEYCLGF